MTKSLYTMVYKSKYKKITKTTFPAIPVTIYSYLNFYNKLMIITVLSINNSHILSFHILLF
jgi:Fe2+ or Zn2+ uptake regulation protein